IEGNCDERGSREYNLALGQRRADSVKKAMTLIGVPAKQIQTVSFGSEKPKAPATTKRPGPRTGAAISFTSASTRNASPRPGSGARAVRRSTRIRTMRTSSSARRIAALLLSALSFAVAIDSVQAQDAARNPGIVQLMNQIESLQGDLSKLRGQLEVLSNGLENAQKRQRDMYLDLDTRLR